MLIVLPLLFGLVLLGLLILFFLIEGWRRRALGAAVARHGGGGGGIGGRSPSPAISCSAWSAPAIIGGLIRSSPTTAVYACALAAAVIGLLLVAGTAERTRLRAAFWLFFTALGGAICFVAPGAAIFFLAPPLAAALGMVAQTLVALGRAGRRHRRRGPALPDLRPGARFVRGADEQQPALDLRASGGGDPAAGPDRAEAVAVAPAGFVGGGGAIDLAITAWLVAAFTPAYSADRQQLFTIEYVWDETRARPASRSTMTARRCLMPATGSAPNSPIRPAAAGPRPRPPAPVAGPGVELVSREAVPAGYGSGCASG